MDYLEELRGVLHELNVGGKEIPGDEDGEDFVENDDTQDEQQPQTTEDQPAEPDDGDEGGEDFMDDDNTGDEQPPQPDDGGEPTEGDDGDEGGEDFMDDDTSSEEGGEGEPTDGDGESSDDEGGEDFMDDGSEGDDGESSEEEGDGESEGDGEEGEDDEESDYDIGKIEDELFSELTPEQIAIKNHELKNNFVELYSIIGSTLVRINDISKSNDNINILKFITEKLLELREMIDYNITTAYQTRTYIENNIIYQQCIATLNTIAEIIEQIPNIDGKKVDNEEDAKEEEDKGYPVEPDTEGQEELNLSDTSATLSQESYDYSSDYNDLF